MPSAQTPDDDRPPLDDDIDVIVVGSGAAGLSAALTASIDGAKVLVLEKSDRLGGTSAMSGSAIWIPANHVARAAGFEDSEEEALRYLHATAPEGWAATEAPLWESFVRNAPATLKLIDEHTPLEFALTSEPDPMAEFEGGKTGGRVVSPRPLRRRVAGEFGRRLRHSTLPHLFTYQEAIGRNPYARPLQATLGLLPKLLWRWLIGARGQGNALIAGLARGCLDQGCRIELGSAVEELIQDDLGTVVGVAVLHGGQRRRLTARRGVVLATGGFEWDAERRQKHFPGPFDRAGSPRTNSGDGHGMAEKAGAALAHMDQANVYTTLPTRYEGQIHGMPNLFHAARHAIVVDRHAQRFASELSYNFGEFLDAREEDGLTPRHLPCWLIADAQFLGNGSLFRWFARNLPGWVRKANTLEQLAAAIDLPADALIATVSRYNDHARAGRDLDFHRGESIWERAKTGTTPDDQSRALGAIERAPFAAVPVNRSILVTKGGPRTNAQGQVLRPDGSVIGGLYCAGVAMANPIGTRNVGAGTTLGPCLTWGYICARSLVRGNR